MSPVKSQGSKRGSCVAYGGVAVKEYQEMKEHDLTPINYIDLSEEYLYQEVRKLYWGDDWQKKQGSDGRSCAKALSVMGVCEEKYYPYDKEKEPDYMPKEGYLDNAGKYRINNDYVRITRESELPAALDKFGPLTISFIVYKNWLNVKEDGIIPEHAWWDKRLGGHLVALTGYNNKTKMYKIKNSWNDTWGDKGFGYISAKEVKKSMMDAFAYIDIPDGEIVITLGGKAFRKEKVIV